MYHPNITFALAKARVADLQRIATAHRMATVPPHRHHRHLPILTLLNLDHIDPVHERTVR